MESAQNHKLIKMRRKCVAKCNTFFSHFFHIFFTFLGFGMGLEPGLPKTSISLSKSTFFVRKVSFCLANLMFDSEKVDFA